MILPRYYFYDDFTEYKDLILDNGAVRMNFSKGKTLYNASKADNTMYYIEEGIARIIAISEAGDESIVFFVGPGCIWSINLLEEAFSLESCLYMVAVTDLRVLAFSKGQLKSMIREKPEFSFEIINHYCRQTNLLISKHFMSTFQDAQKCICTFLYLYLKNKPNEYNMIDLDQKDIASAAGVSQATLTRIFSDLKKEGVIETSRNRLKILDISRLHSLCDELAHV